MEKVECTGLITDGGKTDRDSIVGNEGGGNGIKVSERESWGATMERMGGGSDGQGIWEIGDSMALEGGDKGSGDGEAQAEGYGGEGICRMCRREGCGTEQICLQCKTRNLEEMVVEGVKERKAQGKIWEKRWEGVTSKMDGIGQELGRVCARVEVLEEKAGKAVGGELRSIREHLGQLQKQVSEDGIMGGLSTEQGSGEKREATNELGVEGLLQVDIGMEEDGEELGEEEIDELLRSDTSMEMGEVREEETGTGGGDSELHREDVVNGDGGVRGEVQMKRVQGMDAGRRDTVSIEEGGDWMELIKSGEAIGFRGGEGTWAELSNFYKCKLSTDDQGLTLVSGSRTEYYSSSEQCYQIYKARWNGAGRVARELRELGQGRAEALYFKGKEVIERVGWKQQKVGVMKRLLGLKWEQCGKFREAVRATKGRVIVEDTPNEFWGRGKTGGGQNVLGKMLMELRVRKSGGQLGEGCQRVEKGISGDGMESVPGKLVREPELQESRRVNNGEVWIVGDSIVQQQGELREIIKAGSGSKVDIICIRGLRSRTLGNGAGIERSLNMGKGKVGTIIVHVGTNDIREQWEGLGERVRMIIKGLSDFQGIVERIMGKGVKMVWSPILPRVGGSELITMIQQVNAEVAEGVKSVGWGVLQEIGGWAWDPQACRKLRSFMKEDGLHLSKVGVKFFGEAMGREVGKLKGCQ